jgi:hypothetical protein
MIECHRGTEIQKSDSVLLWQIKFKKIELMKQRKQNGCYAIFYQAILFQSSRC